MASSVDSWNRAFAQAGADARTCERAAQAVVATLRTATPQDRAALAAAMARGSVVDLLDAFTGELAFGTGGCRGKVGLGPNRFHEGTLRRLVRAHAGWLLERSVRPDDCAVVLGWDTRRFHDVDGVFDPQQPPSVLGWSSEDAARFAAQVYTACGISVWWPQTGGTVGSLSCAIRQQRAAGGLYISASHNPPDHNGAKFYLHTGGQVVPPQDEQIAHHPPAHDTSGGSLLDLPDTVREAWLDALYCAVGRPDLEGMPVVYSALHGAGAAWVPRLLAQAGAHVHVVEAQHHPDGRFSTVHGGQPNPENHTGLRQAIELAREVGADLVLATDPDADRLGVGCRGPNGWQVLNGNQIALVCTEAACRLADGPGVVLRTSVTASVISKLAHARGMATRDDAPVGFKYLGVQMDDETRPFCIAVEESHGVLVSDSMRDKDAVGAALLVAVAAKREAPVRTLDRLAAELGAWATALVPRALSGPGARRELDRGLAELRRCPPDFVLGRAVVSVEDGWAGRELTSNSDRASRNMLRLWLADGVVTLRPSGTEAKVKAYAECWRLPGEAAEGLQPSAEALAQAALDLLSAAAARTGR